MKKYIYTICFFTIILASCTGKPNTTSKTDNNFQELIINGNVSNGTEKWGLYVNPPGKGLFRESKGEIEYVIDNAGSDKWHIQGHYAGLSLIKNASYKLKFDMYSTIDRKGQIRIQLDSDPYSAYFEKDIDITTKKQSYEFDFIMKEDSDEFAKLCFNIGMFEENSKLPNIVKVDNLSLLVDKRTVLEGEKKHDMPIIAINQVGYLPYGIKEVRINKDSNGFTVKDLNNEVKFSGKFKKPISDPASGELVFVGDFSDFNEPGKYVIDVNGIGESGPFEIIENVYKPLYDSVFKMFYYQRCGSELTSDIAGVWAHDPCHIEEATIYGTDKKIDVSGGWHDAGDYGRYVSPGAKAVMDLILSKNYTPELLEEIKYELDWMLKMQDSETGGVYHKVTTPGFIGSVMPDKNSTKLIVSPISSTATGAFSAVMSASSRIFKESNPSYSEKLLKSALNAWNWLEENKIYKGFVNPSGITTGEYGDNVDGDERYWASTELFLTTGNKDFLEYAKDSFSKNRWEGLGWQSMGTYGTISYITSNSKIKDLDFNKVLTDYFLEAVSTISSNSATDGYGISLGTKYEWGSNEVVADNGLMLLIAADLTGNNLYRDQALRHLHYILGSNSLGQCYVTGFGNLTVKNPHHRPSNATGEVVPGMLAGGPNSGLQDPLAKAKLTGKAPQKCYIDGEPSYSTNEITVYWNSPLYALITSFVDQ